MPDGSLLLSTCPSVSFSVSQTSGGAQLGLERSWDTPTPEDQLLRCEACQVPAQTLQTLPDNKDASPLTCDYREHSAGLRQHPGPLNCSYLMLPNAVVSDGVGHSTLVPQLLMALGVPTPTQAQVPPMKQGSACMDPVQGSCIPSPPDMRDGRWMPSNKASTRAGAAAARWHATGTATSLKVLSAGASFFPYDQSMLSSISGH